MPVIPALWEAKVDGPLKPRSLRQAKADGETLSLQKIQKKISQVWWHVTVVPLTRVG